MAATKWNQDLNAGQDWMANLNLLKSDGVTNRDITNHTLESKVKRHLKSVAAKLSLRIRIADAATGSISLMLTAAETTLLKSGKYVYDVEVTAPNTLTVKEATGTFIAGEVITGATSGAVGAILTHSTLTKITYTVTSGTFTMMEIINGTTFNAKVVTNDGKPIDRVIEGVFTIRPEVTD